jgi:hypothetical protein
LFFSKKSIYILEGDTVRCFSVKPVFTIFFLLCPASQYCSPMSLLALLLYGIAVGLMGNAVIYFAKCE